MPDDLTARTAGLYAWVHTFITRFVIISEDAACLLALWVLHTWAFDAATITPYVCIRSPTKGCGKSRLLEVLHLVVSNPEAAANISAAVLYRMITPGTEPTLLLDEQDGLFTSRGIDDDKRRILNAGFMRGQKVLRMGGRQFDEVQTFFPFCPKALATIGDLPDTVADRSISVEMKKKLPSERVDVLDTVAASAEAETFRNDAAAWSADAVPPLRASRPSFPEELDDRGRDIFAPLLAIADMSGGELPAKARAAAVKNRTVRRSDRDDVGIQLLRDISAKLTGYAQEFIPSQMLLDSLVQDSELRWAHYSRGGLPLSSRRLRDYLSAFDIEPTTPKVFDGRQRRGYVVAQLEEAFRRYLDEPAKRDEAVAPITLVDGNDIGPFLVPRPDLPKLDDLDD